MTLTHSAFLTSSIGEVGDNVQENQPISMEFQKEAPSKFYTSALSQFIVHIRYSVQALVKYFSKIKHFYKLSYKFNSNRTSDQKQVWEVLLGSLYRKIITNSQCVSKLKPNACRSKSCKTISTVFSELAYVVIGQTNGTELRV